MPVVSGSQLGPYEILSPLGQGGMGEVYVAHDPRLQRRVALKVLPAHLSADASILERFRREAESLAALNHPSIVTIYSVEEEQGTPFLTMELIEGRTLEVVLEHGPLDRATFFRVAIALAEAIEAAHAAGLVHRDLKPANLMLSDDGRLKVLDFGLAKLSPDRNGDQDETLLQVTRGGAVVGTAPYMSPEQANGRPVDEKTDMFSLGTVLYELATGQRPFEGDGLAAVLYAVTQHEPPAVSQQRDDLPPAVSELISSCLIKEPAQREQTAAAIVEALRAIEQERPGVSSPADTLRVEPAKSRQPVIAVLPFRTSAADEESRDFASELAEDVVDGLSRASQVIALPVSATQRFSPLTHGSIVDARAVGVELAASYVIQGKVRHSGNRLRVSVQLVASETGAQIWSRRYDRDLATIDIFAAVDEIGCAIVAAVADIHGVVFEFERQRLKGRAIEDLGPWECVFVGMSYDKFGDQEHHRIARDAFERSVRLDPGLAVGWSFLSWVYTDEVVNGFNPLPDSMSRAMRAAQRGVEIAPHSSYSHFNLSRVYFFEGEIERFLSESDKALELGDEASILGMIGFYTALAGKWQRGLGLIRRAMALNPLYPDYFHWPIALDHFRQGRHEESLVEYRRAVSPVRGLAAVGIAALVNLGREEEATAVLRQFMATDGDLTASEIRSWHRRANIRGDLLEELMAGLEKAGLEG